MWVRCSSRLLGMDVHDIGNGTLREGVVQSSNLMSVGVIFLSSLSE